MDNTSSGWRFGVVVPKRHARRAVTRSLLKRLAREAFVRQLPVLAAGDWLLRVRAPFGAAEFVSADSPRLRAVVRDELGQLFAGAAAGAGGSCR